MDANGGQQESIFRSKLPDIYIPNHLPLHTYCFENISQFSNRPCLINGSTGDIYTYADVELAVGKFASGLHTLGIQKGDVIMLLLHNSPEFAFAFLGASHLGAISTTANPFCTTSEISKQVKASKTKLIVTQSCYVEKVKDLIGKNNDDIIKLVIVTDSEEKGNYLRFSELMSKGNENEIPAVKINPGDDVVALPYSSGTTGFPKGVMLTHKGLITSIAQQVDGENPNLYLHKEDVIICVLPLFHIYSLNSVLLCGLRVGATILIMPKFDIIRLMELVQKYRVTIAPFVPPIVLAIAKCPFTDKYDLSSIRMLMSGAAPLGRELEDTVKAKLPNAILGQVFQFLSYKLIQFIYIYTHTYILR